MGNSDNEEKVPRVWIFYSANQRENDPLSHIYYFDKENPNEEHELPFRTKSHLTWCIWKHFILFLHRSIERICWYDILNEKIEENSDFRGIEQTNLMPIKIIMCLKYKLYLVDEANNLYIYK